MRIDQAPLQIDGLTLEPELQALMAAIEPEGAPGLESLTPAQGREVARIGLDEQSPMHVGRVVDLAIDGPGGALELRHFLPAEADRPVPLMVYFHGGGFVICDLDTHDAVCRLLCRHAGVQVLAVDYRRAPEHPYPAALEDGIAALDWAVANARQLGADPERVCVGGDSVGGSLAAALAQRTRTGGGPSLALQLLIYPWLDFATTRRSHELFADGPFLTRPAMDWFCEHALPLEVDRADVRLSPLLAPDVTGLAPAYVATAGFDMLRDEGEEYARRLRDAGGRAVLRRFPSLLHGFLTMTDASPASRDAVIEMAGSVRALLDAAVQGVPIGTGFDARAGRRSQERER